MAVCTTQRPAAGLLWLSPPPQPHPVAFLGPDSGRWTPGHLEALRAPGEEPPGPCVHAQTGDPRARQAEAAHVHHPAALPGVRLRAQAAHPGLTPCSPLRPACFDSPGEERAIQRVPLYNTALSLCDCCRSTNTYCPLHPLRAHRTSFGCAKQGHFLGAWPGPREGQDVTEGVRAGLGPSSSHPAGGELT